MTMETIKLSNQEWRIDTNKRLGTPGGFGEVFSGQGNDGEVAIKRLKLTAAEAAHRELEIGKALYGRLLVNVVPVLDWGQDADSDRYFLVMPVCERSLQDAINEKGRFHPGEAAVILMAILAGLGEVRDITHRDMKPSNVLLHDGIWKVADFGIAKFVEDSTSLESLRSNLTPAYAAPEQWLLQRPTPATDIYAVACIAHALVTGKPPFAGDMDTLRDQHLNKIPALLQELPPSAKNIVSMMLRKVPEIRPKRERCAEVFKQCTVSEGQVVSRAASAMAEAVSLVAVDQAKREAERRVSEEKLRQREALFNEAVHDLHHIKQKLFSRILEHARDVVGGGQGQIHSPRLTFGHAALSFDIEGDRDSLRGIRRGDDARAWGDHRRRSKWDIVAFGEMSITQASGRHSYLRSANLVFGRPLDDAEYRWFEMAFWSLGDVRGLQGYPSCLRYVFEIDEALSSAVSIMNRAYEPVPIDGENEEAFVEYWMGIMALAAMGKLTRPMQMPMPR